MQKIELEEMEEKPDVVEDEVATDSIDTSGMRCAAAETDSSLDPKPKNSPLPSDRHRKVFSESVKKSAKNAGAGFKSKNSPRSTGSVLISYVLSGKKEIDVNMMDSQELTSPTQQIELEETDEKPTDSVNTSGTRCAAAQVDSGEPNPRNPSLTSDGYRKVFSESVKASAKNARASFNCKSNPQSSGSILRGKKQPDTSLRNLSDKTADGPSSLEDSSLVSVGKRKRSANVEESPDASEAINELDANITVSSNPTDEHFLSEDASQVSSGKRKISVGVRQSLDTSEDLDVVAGPSGIRPQSLGQGEKEYRCNECGEEFSNGHDFDEHYNIKHRNKVSCNSPTKVFSPEKNLQSSHKTHQGKNVVVCNVGEKKFAANQVLDSSHSDEMPYVCNVCAKRFAEESKFVSHCKKVHTREKAFVCELCAKAFARRDHLQRHKRSHTGEKPFACDVCYKRFSSNQSLKNHQTTHTGQKSFACEVCKKEFATKGSMKRHYRTHTGEKPFVCSVCDKIFSQRCHFTRHELTHSGNKPFECDVCGKAFSRKDHRDEHESTHK